MLVAQAVGTDGDVEATRSGRAHQCESRVFYGVAVVACAGNGALHVAELRCYQRHLSLNEWLAVYLSFSSGEALQGVPCVAFVDDMAHPGYMFVLICRVKEDGSVAAIDHAMGDLARTPG